MKMSKRIVLAVVLVALLAVQATAYVTISRHKAGGTRISKSTGLAAPTDCAALCESTASCTHASSTRRRTESTWTCSLLSAMSRMTSAPRAVVYVMDEAAASRTYKKFSANALEIAAPYLKRKQRNLDPCKKACDMDANCDAVSQRGKYCYFHNTDETPKAMQRYPVWVVVTAGCMDPMATNYNSAAVVDDGSCTIPAGMGCGNSHALNYDSDVITHNEAMCEYPTAGCMDSLASNFNPMVSVDDGSCTFPAGTGCGDMNALNYDSNVVTHNEALCEFPPEFVLTPYPGKKYSGGVFVRRANGVNRDKCQQLCMSMGDECHGINSVSTKCFVYSTNHHEQGSIASSSRTNYYAKERVGCTNNTALNFNSEAQADWDPTLCRFDGVGTLSGGGTSGSTSTTSSSGPDDVMTGSYYGLGRENDLGLSDSTAYMTGPPVPLPELEGAVKVYPHSGAVFYLTADGVLKCMGQCKNGFSLPDETVTGTAARRLHYSLAAPDLTVYNNYTIGTPGPIKDFWLVKPYLVTLGVNDVLYIRSGSYACARHMCGHDNFCSWDLYSSPAYTGDETACHAHLHTPFTSISSSWPTSKVLKDIQFTDKGMYALFADGSVWTTGREYVQPDGEGWTEKVPAGAKQISGNDDNGIVIVMDDGSVMLSGWGMGRYAQSVSATYMYTLTTMTLAKPVAKAHYGTYLVLLYTDGTVESFYRSTSGVTSPHNDYVELNGAGLNSYAMRSDGTIDCLKDSFVADCVDSTNVGHLIPSRSNSVVFSA